MGFLTYFSSSSKVAVNVVNVVEKETPQVPAAVTELPPASAKPVPALDASNSETTSGDSVPTNPEEIPLPLSPATSTPESYDPAHPAPKSPRRLSFRPFAVSHPRNDHKHALSAVQEHEKKVEASAAFSKRMAMPLLRKSSDKKAEESALMVRDLIVGPTKVSPSVTKAVARPQMSKLKSQLMKPKSANKVITHLRSLPAEADLPSPANADKAKKTGPIHAVCLSHTDEEEHTLYFSKLSKANDSQQECNVASASADCGSPAFDTLSTLFDEMNIIDLVNSPDLGLGQPGNGKGILAGAVPTAETVIKGVQQITPQLMALGYATGRAIVPDHTGIHPPTDRMSVLTYWWGLEIVMPPPTLAYLNSVHSVSGTVVNFLSALALVNNGVREILPFVRYISQFIDFEFKTIQAQDNGNGVVCAATWIMPAAMVPRPWDFTPPVEILLPPTQPPEGALSSPTNGEKSGKGQELPKDKAPESDRSGSEPQEPSTPEKSPPDFPVVGVPAPDGSNSGAVHSPVISPVPITPLPVVAASA